MLRFNLAALSAAILFSLASCGGPNQAGGPASDAPAALDLLAAAPESGIGGLPADGVQPWERLSTEGYVEAASDARAASAFPAAAQFAPGVERFLESTVPGGYVQDFGEASRLTSGSPGSSILTWAVYRLTMGGIQPAGLALDLNLRPRDDGAPSEYYIALSAFGSGYWRWLGPFADGQAVLTLEEGDDLLSPLGSTFVAIMLTAGSKADIVGVMAAPRNGADTAAPPVPSAPVATPIAGGLELSWVDVVAGDLAGYRVHYSYSPFDAADDPGVKTLPQLENTTRVVLPAQPRTLFVALSAVDTQGNASELSEVVRALPKPGQAVPAQLLAESASGLRGAAIELTATGGDLYDFDLDGDGSFEVTDSADGTALADTSATGLIRPRVRVRQTEPGGESVALGSVSLIISGNQRPVASAVVDPQEGVASGTAPLAVSFDGSASTDFDGTIAQWAWDRTGDGIYERVSGVSPDETGNFSAAGTYNAKLRVTDDQGAWDVDSVVVTVHAATATLTATPSYVAPGHTVALTATAPMPALQYEWDLDDDGSYETNTGAVNAAEYAALASGEHLIRVRITTSGGQVFGQASITVKGWKYARNIAPGDFVGRYINLLDIGGKPAIVFPQGLPEDAINFMLANDERGESWGAPVAISQDPGQYQGYYSSAALINGNPAVTWIDNPGWSLHYARANDPQGASWAPKATLGVLGGFSQFSSLAEVNGRPAIAFYDSNVDNPIYVRANDAAGGSWPAAASVVLTANDDGSAVQLRVVAGNPALAYLDTTAGSIVYVRAADVNGVTWGSPLPLSTGVSFSSIGFEVVSGRPALSYSLSGSGHLMYRPALDSIGSIFDLQRWAAPPDEASSILGSTLIEWRGLPAIGASDWGTSSLLTSIGATTEALQFERSNVDVVWGASNPSQTIALGEFDGRLCAAYAHAQFGTETLDFAMLY